MQLFFFLNPEYKLFFFTLMKNVNNLPRIQRNNMGRDNCSGLRKVMKTSAKLLKKKLQVWTGPEGSRSFRLSDFKMAHEYRW